MTLSLFKNALKRLFRRNTWIKGTLTVIAKSRVYKIPVAPIGWIRMFREIYGASKASNQVFFKEMVVPIKLYFGFLAVSKRKKTLTNEEQLLNFEQTVTKAAISIFRHPKVCPSEVIKLNWLQHHPDLQGNNPNISSIDLNKIPLTPQHGDLKPGNAVLCNKNMKLIDWELYRERGSFLLDYVDYRFRMTFSERGQSLENYIKWIRSVDEQIENVLAGTNIKQRWLKSVFLLDRCQRTMHRLCMDSVWGRVNAKSAFYKDNLQRIKLRFLSATEYLSELNNEK